MRCDGLAGTVAGLLAQLTSPPARLATYHTHCFPEVARV